MWLPRALFTPSSEKKNHSKKKVSHFLKKNYFLKFRENPTLIFQKTELSSPENKIFQEKIFQTIKYKQNLLRKICCISRNATLK